MQISHVYFQNLHFYLNCITISFKKTYSSNQIFRSSCDFRHRKIKARILVENFVGGNESRKLSFWGNIAKGIFFWGGDIAVSIFLNENVINIGTMYIITMFIGAVPWRSYFRGIRRSNLKPTMTDTLILNTA